MIVTITQSWIQGRSNHGKYGICDDNGITNGDFYYGDDALQVIE